jgi:drug/metabolite transporter (DMT)-like permease
MSLDMGYVRYVTAGNAMIEALAEGLAGLIGSLIVGWRSALGMCCGLVLACIIVWAGSPHRGSVWMVAALAAVLCYGFSLGWELSAKRRRRIRPQSNNRFERSRIASSVSQGKDR